jgi:hypothetical protein
MPSVSYVPIYCTSCGDGGNFSQKKPMSQAHWNGRNCVSCNVRFVKGK